MSVIEHFQKVYLKDLDFVLYYGSFMVYIPLGIWLYKRVQKPFQLILLLLIYSGLHELISRWLKIQYINLSILFSHITIFPEFYLYLLIYYHLDPQPGWKSKLFYIGLGFTVLGILNSIYLQPPPKNYSTITLMLEAVLLSGLALNLFTRMQEINLQKNLLTEGVFWFNCSILFFYSFIVLIWGFHGLEVYRLNNPPLFMYSLLKYLSTFLYSMFLLSAWLNSRNTYNKNQRIH